VEEADLDFLGEVTWDFPSNPDWNMRAWIYTADRFTGSAAPSAEITPQWYLASDPPWAGMWEDAGHWLPRVLAREPFSAEITLDARSIGVARAVLGGPADARGAGAGDPGLSTAS
jgi:8-oxo-dGTP diphosphatase